MGKINQKIQRLVFYILTFYPILTKLTHYSVKGLTNKELKQLQTRGLEERRSTMISPDKDEIINIINSIVYEDAVKVITKLYIPAITTIATVIIAIVAITK